MLTLDIHPPLFDVLQVMDMLALGNIDTISAGKKLSLHHVATDMFETASITSGSRLD
jgi:hypothetical protein